MDEEREMTPYEEFIRNIDKTLVENELARRIYNLLGNERTQEKMRICNDAGIPPINGVYSDIIVELARSDMEDFAIDDGHTHQIIGKMVAEAMRSMGYDTASEKKQRISVEKMFFGSATLFEQ